MSRAFQLLICLTILGSIAFAAPKTEEYKPRPECRDFAKDAVFNETKVLGIWPIIHYTSEKPAEGKTYCVQFTNVTEQERKDIANVIGKHVNHISWDNVVLKMQIPCDGVLNRTVIKYYYLERNEGVGAYKILQVPPTTVNMDAFHFHRLPLMMKFVEEEYLAMIDCVEEFMFLMGKAAPRSQAQERRLKDLLQMYGPETGVAERELGPFTVEK